jgi:hypothetical protein
VNRYTCKNPDCTVAITGKCVLSCEPIESCKNVTITAAAVSSEPARGGAESATTVTTVYHGQELGWMQAAPLLAARYGLLIGLLGESATGKTCLLSSLYLLASCGELQPAFQFAGSATLPGFERRIRLLREWSGATLPETISEHTILTDERQPGLLHLALRSNEVASARDLLLTDLPGEWTTDLVRRADKASRLAFFRRADVVVIALSGPDLATDETRNRQIQFSRMLVQRLRDAVGVDLETPIIFAVTRCDMIGTIAPAAIYRIVDAATDFGFKDVSYTLVAAFSDRSDIPSGLGVPELLSKVFRKRDPHFYSRDRDQNANNRAFASFVAAGDPSEST